MRSNLIQQIHDHVELSLRAVEKGNLNNASIYTREAALLMKRYVQGEERAAEEKRRVDAQHTINELTDLLTDNKMVTVNAGFTPSHVVKMFEERRRILHELALLKNLYPATQLPTEEADNE